VRKPTAGPWSTAPSPSPRCGPSSPRSADSSGRGGCWKCAGGTHGGEGVSGDPPEAGGICGYAGAGGRGAVSEVWGLDLATMRWEAMPALLSARRSHACCAVRGALVVLGGWAPGVGVPHGQGAPASRVEMLSKGEGAFVELPPLSCGVKLRSSVQDSENGFLVSITLSYVDQTLVYKLAKHTCTHLPIRSIRSAKTRVRGDKNTCVR